jgi:hypothetical protein
MEVKTALDQRGANGIGSCRQSRSRGGEYIYIGVQVLHRRSRARLQLRIIHNSTRVRGIRFRRSHVLRGERAARAQ